LRTTPTEESETQGDRKGNLWDGESQGRVGKKN